MSKRRGFTLVELLVVMAIITVLGALVASGVMGWISGQSRRNTENQIRFLQNAIIQHSEIIINDARAEKSIPAAVMTFADNNSDRARIIWTKMRLMEAFPVRFSEITNAYATAPLSYIPIGNRRYMANYKAAVLKRTGATQSKTESAACLLLALSVNRSGVYHSPETMQPFTKDMDNDGLPEFVDGWGEPMYFYRFATLNADLQASRPANLVASNYDPLDPRGLLRTWVGGYSTAFDSSVHPRLNGADAWYAVPVVVSSGPNMKTGLAANSSAPYADMSVLTPIDADDNVYSYKIK